MAWRSGQRYSAELRERVLAAVDGGLPAKTAAERLDVRLSFIYNALKRERLIGETTARRQRNQQKLELAAYDDAIHAEAVLRPDTTLEEVRARLLATHGVEASLGPMHDTLARLGPTPKKNLTGRGAGSAGHRRTACRLPGRASRAERRASDLRPGCCSGTRPARRPSSPDATVGADAASVASRLGRTATGRARASSAT